MERDSFIFYRSYYEAIKELPKDIQLELYTAILEYALDGINPDNLKPIASAMFKVMKPNIDTAIEKYENRGGRSKKKDQKKPDPQPEPYSLSFEEEVNIMRSDPEWIEAICKDYKIDIKELSERLGSFLRHCRDTRADRPHDSSEDARSHLRYWMTKAYPPVPMPKESHSPKKTGRKNITSEPAGSPECASVTARLDELDRQQKERDQKWEEQRRKTADPNYLIKKYGYDPDKVKISQVMNEKWRAANPPESIP